MLMNVTEAKEDDEIYDVKEDVCKSTDSREDNGKMTAWKRGNEASHFRAEVLLC